MSTPPDTDTIFCHERPDFPGGMEFYCPYCKEIHRHGRGDGWRSPHCIEYHINNRGGKIPTNTPYSFATGREYKIVLKYPYDPKKEKIYSTKPRITINTKATYSTITMDLDNTLMELTEDGSKAIGDYTEQFFPSRKKLFQYMQWSCTHFQAKVKKELRFHVAQAILNIVSEKKNITRKTFVCMVCGKRSIVPENTRRYELAICDMCKRVR